MRCNKVRLEASEQQRDEAARTVRPPVVYRCLVCHASMPQPESVCQRCRDTDRYREQPDDSLPTLRRETGAFPHLAWYTNAQGESVVNGRVLPHPRYGESAWDRFGDTPDWD